MRSGRAFFFFLVLVVILGGFTFFAAQPVLLAQGPDGNEYIGARECSSCHRGLSRDHNVSAHGRTLLEPQEDADPPIVVADFGAGEDVREVQFPGEDAARPFTLDDVAYVLGAGRTIQRYLYEADDGYYVLPAQWNVAAEAWEPYTLAEAWPDPGYAFGPNCAYCHTVGLNVEDFTWLDDGVQCEACHGPGLNHVNAADDAGNRPSDEELGGIRSAITISADAQVCGQCHVQGQSADTGLPYPQGYQPGGTLGAEDNFTPYPPDDSAHWWASGHARSTNMQFNEWDASAHASSLEALRSSAAAEDACLGCHSSDYRRITALRELYDAGEYDGEAPPAVTLETAQFGVTCLTCHNPHFADEDLPAQLVSDPVELCTGCHTNTDLFTAGTGVHHPVQEMFAGTTLVASVEGIPAAHASEDGPDCLTCHMPVLPTGATTRTSHRWRPVLPAAAEEGEPDACTGCHQDLSSGDLQFLIDDIQESVRGRLATGFARLASLQQPDAEADSAEGYADVAAALAFVQGDGSMGVHNYAYVDALLTFAERTLSELSVPGAVIQPTEAPAPTAIADAPPLEIGGKAEESASRSVRPITLLIVVVTGLVLLTAAALIFRRPRPQDGGRA